MKTKLYVIFIAMSCFISTVSFGQQETKPDETLIGPVTYTHEYQGIAIAVPVTVFLKAQTSSDGIDVRARSVANLLDLQNKIGSIIDTIKLPTDNCQSFSANNPVARIWGKQLTLSNNRAVLNLKGDVEVWDCRENPVPNSKVEWVIEEIPWTGIKTKVPKTIFWPGNPIKNKLATQPFDANIPLLAHSPNQQTVELVIESPDIKLGGQFIGVTNAILRIAGIDINAYAKQAIDKAIDPSKLRQTLPEEIKKFNPSIESVGFTGQGGVLNLESVFTAKVPSSAITELLKLLLAKNS